MSVWIVKFSVDFDRHNELLISHSIPIYDLVSDSERPIEIIVIISGLASYFRIHGLCIEYGEGEFYFR